MATSEIKIRQYEEKDHETVLLLHKKALESANAYAGVGPWDDDLKDIKSNYIDARGDFLVGEIEGKIVAMGAIRSMSDDTAELKRLRVDPDFQRRGFGQMILEKLEQRAKELEYRSIKLDVAPHQNAARHLYVKNNYKEVSEGDRFGYACIYYEKML